MVWCLLVVPNCRMADPLAKVNKTSGATQIPLCSTHNQTWRDMDTSKLNLTCFCLTYFGHPEKRLLMLTWYFFKHLLLRCELKMRLGFWASPTSVFASGPSEHCMALWNSLSGIQIFCAKISSSLSSDDSGCYLLCALIQMYYVFMSTSFTCHKAPSLCCRLSFLSSRWWGGHTQTQAPMLTLWLFRCNALYMHLRFAPRKWLNFTFTMQGFLIRPLVISQNALSS